MALAFTAGHKCLTLPVPEFSGRRRRKVTPQIDVITTQLRVSHLLGPQYFASEYQLLMHYGEFNGLGLLRIAETVLECEYPLLALEVRKLIGEHKCMK